MSDRRSRFRRLLPNIRGGRSLRHVLLRRSNDISPRPMADEPLDNSVKDRGTGQELEIHDLPDSITVDGNVTPLPEANHAPYNSPGDWPIGPLSEAHFVPDILVNYEHTVSPPEPGVQSGPSSYPEQSDIIQAPDYLFHDRSAYQTREINILPASLTIGYNSAQYNVTASDDDPDRLSFVADTPDIISVGEESETHEVHNEEPADPDAHGPLLKYEIDEVYNEELTDPDTREPFLESNGISQSPSVDETIDPFSRGEICQGPLPERAMPDEYLHEYFSVFDAIKARTLEIHGTYETFHHGPRVPIGYSRLLDEHFLPRAEDNDRGSPLCIGPTEIALELWETRYDQSVPSPYDWNKPAIGGYDAGFKYTKQELVRPMQVAFRHLGSSFEIAEKVRPPKSSTTGYTPCKEPCKGRFTRPDDFGHSSRIENSLQRDQNAADFVFYYQELDRLGSRGVLPYVILETKSPGFINNAKWRDWENHSDILELLDRARRLAKEFECPNFCIYDCLSIIYISFHDLHQPVISSEKVTVHMACDRVRNRKDPNFYGFPSQDRKKWHRFTVREILYYALVAGIQRVAFTHFRLWPSYTPLRWEPEPHEAEYQSVINTIYGQPVWDIDGTTIAGYAYLERTGVLREDGTPLVRLMVRPARPAGRSNTPRLMSTSF